VGERQNVGGTNRNDTAGCDETQAALRGSVVSSGLRGASGRGKLDAAQVDEALGRARLPFLVALMVMGSVVFLTCVRLRQASRAGAARHRAPRECAQRKTRGDQPG
jgi:hypothetical protein